jgi:hypothetical protein
MNTALKVSLIANLLLTGGFLWLAGQKGMENNRPETVGAVQGLASEGEASVSTAAPVVQSPGSASFHWSQLEASDYRTYIANLRGIGCPEQTIRDIITADLHSQYVARSEPSDPQISGTTQPVSPSGGSFTARSSEPGRQQLLPEEAQVLRVLLGSESSEAMSAVPTIAPAAPQQRGNRLPDTEASLSVAVSELDPNKMTLTQAQSEMLNALRDGVAGEIGSGNSDPQAPATLRQWPSAEFLRDSFLRGMFGRQFFLNYQLAQARQ